MNMGKKAEEPIGVDGFSHSLLFYNIKRDIQITYGYLKGFSELSNDFFTIRKKIDVDLSPKNPLKLFFVTVTENVTKNIQRIREFVQFFVTKNRDHSPYILLCNNKCNKKHPVKCNKKCNKKGLKFWIFCNSYCNNNNKQYRGVLS